MKSRRSRNVCIILTAIAISIYMMPINVHGAEANINEKPDAAVACTEKEPTAEEKASLQFKTELIKIVNAEREKTGVLPLSSSEELAKPADLRAAEINISFSHTRPGGERWVTVFDKYSLEYTRAGENLANGFKTPEAVMKAWMNSPSHRANILNPDYASIGIGYFKDAKGKIYLSQLFYTPMPKETVEGQQQ